MAPLSSHFWSYHTLTPPLSWPLIIGFTFLPVPLNSCYVDSLFSSLNTVALIPRGGRSYPRSPTSQAGLLSSDSLICSGQAQVPVAQLQFCMPNLRHTQQPQTPQRISWTAAGCHEGLHQPDFPQVSSAFSVLGQVTNLHFYLELSCYLSSYCFPCLRCHPNMFTFKPTIEMAKCQLIHPSRVPQMKKISPLLDTLLVYQWFSPCTIIISIWSPNILYVPWGQPLFLMHAYLSLLCLVLSLHRGTTHNYMSLSSGL